MSPPPSAGRAPGRAPADRSAVPHAADAGAIRTETLTSGMRLVTEAMADVHSVAIGFWVDTGARDEPAGLEGASHFLEHLLFKGTEERSAAAIAEALDEVGGDCNAYTTKEYTTFYIRLLAEHLDLGLDILSDILWQPALREVDVAAERMVILDEILMHGDEPAEVVADQWAAALYPGHPLGREVLGRAETVEAITASQVRSFFEDHYRPANMVVSVAGDLEHAQVVDGLERSAVARRGGAPPVRVAPSAPVRPLVVLERPTEQAHLVLGVRSVSRFDEDRWPLAVLNHTLGGGLSSRLFQKVREQRGLAYSIWSERVGYADTGALSIGVGTAPEHVDEVLQVVTAELELLAADGITGRELAVAQSNLRADSLLAAEDSGARMSRIGAALLLHGQVQTIEEILCRIEAVTLDDVRRVAADVARAPRVLAAVGPFDAGAFDPVALGLASPAA